MSILSDMETALLEMVTEDVFGADHTIDGTVVTCIFSAAVPALPGQYPGQIVERRQLIAAKDDLSLSVGQEIAVDSVTWHVVEEKPSELITNVICERYTA